MKWKKFTLKTLSEVEDIVISTLAEAGVEGVEIEDKVPLTESDKQQMFVDILPDFCAGELFVISKSNKYKNMNGVTKLCGIFHLSPRIFFLQFLNLHDNMILMFDVNLILTSERIKVKQNKKCGI